MNGAIIQQIIMGKVKSFWAKIVNETSIGIIS